MELIQENESTDIIEDFTPFQIKELKNSVMKLEKEELFEIFNIIKLDDEKYTENKNGVFVNMSKLKFSTLNKLKNFLEFCKDNKQNLKDNQEKIDEIKNIVDHNIYETSFNTDVNSNDNINNETIEVKNMVFDNIEEDYKYNNTKKIDYNLTDLEKQLLKNSTDIMKNELKQKKNMNQIKNKLIRKNYDNKVSYRVIDKNK